MTGKSKKKPELHQPLRGDDLSLPEKSPRHKAEYSAALDKDRTKLKARLDILGVDLSEYERKGNIEKAKLLLQMAGKSSDVNFDYIDDVGDLISDLEDLINYSRSSENYDSVDASAKIIQISDFADAVYLGVLAVAKAEIPISFSNDDRADHYLRKFIRDWTMKIVSHLRRRSH